MQRAPELMQLKTHLVPFFGLPKESVLQELAVKKRPVNLVSRSDIRNAKGIAWLIDTVEAFLFSTEIAGVTRHREVLCNITSVSVSLRR